MLDVQIVPASAKHLESFRQCLHSVAKERDHIARLEAPSKLVMEEQFDAGQRNGFMQDWAMVGDRVVGWAVVIPNNIYGLSHSAEFAMGVHREFRRQGIGQRLTASVIEKAWQSELERIELEVWSNNRPAIALYEKLGFQHEGVLRNYRFLDGKYTNAVMMALLRE